MSPRFELVGKLRAASVAQTRVAVAVISLVLMVLTWAVSALTAPGQIADTVAMLQMISWGLYVSEVPRQILAQLTMPLSVGMVLVALIVALVQRRYAVFVRSILWVGSAAVLSQVLKYVVFGRIDTGIGYLAHNSLPSGHTTMAAMGSLSLLVVFGLYPGLCRLAVGWTFGVGWLMVLQGWHRPADVVSAVFLVTLLGALFAPEEFLVGFPRGDSPWLWGAVLGSSLVWVVCFLSYGIISPELVVVTARAYLWQLKVAHYILVLGVTFSSTVFFGSVVTLVMGGPLDGVTTRRALKNS